MGLALIAYVLTTMGTLILGTPLFSRVDFPATYLESCKILSGAEDKPMKCFFEPQACSEESYIDAAFVPYEHRISKIRPETLSAPLTLTDTNISLAFNPQDHAENLVIMVSQQIFDDERIVCWMITFPENVNPPLACVSLNFKNTHQSDAWKVSPNIYEYDKGECLVTADSIKPTILRYPATRSLKLALNLGITTSTSVILYSGNCSTVVCNGSMSGCYIDNRHALQYSIVGKPFELDFNALSAEYHCARMVFPCLIGCGVFCTPTVQLGMPPPPIPPPRQVKPLGGALVFSTALICMLFVLLLLMCVYYANSQVDECPHRPRHTSLELVLKRGTEEENLCPTPPPPSIFLLYSRDSAKFCRVIEAFRQLLEKYIGVMVYDPFDESQIEEVSQNMSGWVTSLLDDPNVKVIMIVSKGAALRQRAMLKNKQLVFREPHSLDPIFTYALKQLHENPTLSQDYSKIFPVRFADFVTDNMNLSLITPHKCFVLMKHFDMLVSELLEIDPETEMLNTGIRKGCKAEFYNLKIALGNMKNKHYQKPNFTHFRYSANRN